MGWLFTQGASKSDIINDLIAKCVKEVGATAVTITHDMASARNVKYRRLVFKNVYVPYQPERDVTGVFVRSPELQRVDEIHKRVESFFDERGAETIL